MLEKIILLTLILACTNAPVMARTTIISGTSGSTLDSSLGNADINDILTTPTADIPDVNYQFDKDGFIIGDTALEPELTEEEKAAKAKKDRIEEERNRPTQIYRGAEANKPKLEAPRTHLMYEPTRY